MHATSAQGTSSPQDKFGGTTLVKTFSYPISHIQIQTITTPATKG